MGHDMDALFNKPILSVELKDSGYPRPDWPEGEWFAEPCVAVWQIGQFRIQAFRQMCLGQLCGYLEIPAGHPWHGVHYDSLEGISVHGGLTYSETSTQGNGAWVLGFDCCHVSDLVPKMFDRRMAEFQTYKNMRFVFNQLVKLVEQADRAAV